jgi:predicted RNA-binding Zn-ribbon protein involved in translation (DUF1610 family)
MEQNRAPIETVYVERAGPSHRPVTQPPARCARCACPLSRYRDPDASLCAPCAASTAATVDRELRVALLAAGRALTVEPDPAFLCPLCGDLKSATARRCARCRYRAAHPRKPPNGASLKAGPCPVCGGRKTPRSRYCRACHYADQRLLFTGNPAITCSGCGGPKVRKARSCRACRHRSDHGTVYRHGRPVHLVCPDCGGPKKLGRAARCRPCAARFRSRPSPSAAG